jgi:hypothetical protein
MDVGMVEPGLRSGWDRDKTDPCKRHGQPLSPELPTSCLHQA